MNSSYNTFGPQQTKLMDVYSEVCFIQFNGIYFQESVYKTAGTSSSNSSIPSFPAVVFLSIAAWGIEPGNFWILPIQ